MSDVSHKQVSSTLATGYFPLGRNWPFQRQVRKFAFYSADYSDNEDDDTADPGKMDKERRQILWDIIVKEVENDTVSCGATILELSDPKIFMLLSIEIELLNDLLFLDHLTDSNNTFTYMANTLHELAPQGKEQTTAPHMELPYNCKLLVYWKNLLSNVGDFFRHHSSYTFFRYHKDKNKKFGAPTRTLHTLDLCLPLHFIFYLLHDARSEPCPQAKPFGRKFLTKIPRFLVDFKRPRFQEVQRDIVYEGSHDNFKWKYNDKRLNDDQVSQVARIAKCGIGNAFKKEAWVDFSNSYQYTRGERPWVFIDNEQEHVEDVQEHDWRVHYMSPEFLASHFEKSMGTKTFTKEDKDQFTERHLCDHPAHYNIPQFILNQSMGPLEGKTFKNAWKDPNDLAEMYALQKNPWAQQIKDCMTYNVEHGRPSRAKKRKR